MSVQLWIGAAIAVATAVFIIFVGVRFLVTPQAFAANFGLPNWPSEAANSWLNLKGVRDIVSGLVIAVPLAFGEWRVLAVLMAVAALTPIGDALVVLKYRGRKAMAYGVHGGTALLVLVGAFLLGAGS
ncbi:DUF4267 domain-containing protein [Amycolatopsis sp. CA-230715]|uniref:DUF4267 domain-containing protein n=1 Tax=Amycolatopsis sp. CA-230715 TaxID=2745196 RepID=UPI001C038656|nr:DUF4267 domain-containing protein [Amycolatopsis sp. CA-230715]QWF84761.1 hypothetical protein HUW46_08213 [Amycolatopsis sp. CA-230715]